VPVTQTASALIAMMTCYLFMSYRIWGSRSGGGETPVCVQVFFKTFLQSRKIIFSSIFITVKNLFMNIEGNLISRLPAVEIIKKCDLQLS